VLDDVNAPLDDLQYRALLRPSARNPQSAPTPSSSPSPSNPITMARMDRLFGVTMAERGVSSIELAEAERMLEAG
jgi:chromosome segregation protein